MLPVLLNKVGPEVAGLLNNMLLGWPVVDLKIEDGSLLFFGNKLLLSSAKLLGTSNDLLLENDI